jgi:hypothetical protein
VGGIALVLLLVGAAFIGGWLLNSRPANPVGGLPQVMGGKGKGGDIQFQEIPALELPAAAPDVQGEFVRRADNSIFVCAVTGKLVVKPDGSVGKAGVCQGPLMEVVLGHDTTFYKDVTEKQLNNQPPHGTTIQLVVEPGLPDEIIENMLISAWGERRGDRLLARVVYYRSHTPISLAQ